LFTSKPVHVEFVVKKVAMGQIFLWALWFSPLSIILSMLHSHSFLQPSIEQLHQTHTHTLSIIITVVITFLCCKQDTTVFKLSPCCSNDKLSSGYFPGVWVLKAEE
jgi:SNF family Na+-dependent transporter